MARTKKTHEFNLEQVAGFLFSNPFRGSGSHLTGSSGQVTFPKNKILQPSDGREG